jgi:hypothetical protein
LSSSGVYHSHSRSFGFSKDRNEKDFCGTVVGWGKVELLLFLDLSPSLITFSRSRFLAKLESVVKDQFLLRLISSFLELPIIDNTGMGKASSFRRESTRNFSCLLKLVSSGILPLPSKEGQFS